MFIFQLPLQSWLRLGCHCACSCRHGCVIVVRVVVEWLVVISCGGGDGNVFVVDHMLLAGFLLVMRLVLVSIFGYC